MHPTPTFLTPFDLSPVQIFPPSDVIDSIHTEGSGAFRRRLRTLVEEHGSVFTRSVRRNPSLVAPMALDVRTRTTTTTTDWSPLCGAAPPLPDSSRQILLTLLAQLLNGGVIRRSHSSTGASIREIHANGAPRLEINYRELNATVHIPHTGPPLGDLSVMMQRIGPHRACLLGIFNLEHGLHPTYQLGIHEPHRHHTAFGTPWGMFEWNRVPLGLKCANAFWYNQISIALVDKPDYVCTVYLKYLIVWGSDEDTLLEHLGLVFERLAKRNITLEAATSRIGVPLPWIGTADDVAQALVRILLQEGKPRASPQRRKGGGGSDAASGGHE